jgi:hypothetical protein
MFSSTPTGPADATLSFPNVLGTSYKLLGGNVPSEEDGFQSTSFGFLFLEVPGIVGESSVPGHPDVMQIQSVAIANNEFSVVKAVDRASPDILRAVLLQSQFSTASLLFYHSTPTGPPDATLDFGQVVASSYQTLVPGGGGSLQEQDGFRFTSILSGSSVVKPEPSSLALLSVGAVGLVAAVYRRRRERAG